MLGRLRRLTLFEVGEDGIRQWQFGNRLLCKNGFKNDLVQLNHSALWKSHQGQGVFDYLLEDEGRTAPADPRLWHLGGSLV